MKRLFLILSLLLLSFGHSFADSLDDIDYRFLDTAFDGIKPVTSKQFNDTINSLTPQPVENTFKEKVKAFLFGRKYGVTEQPKAQETQTTDIGGEQKAIQDIKNGVYFIRIVAPIVSVEGKVIPLGDYKIKEKKDEENLLAFYQGQKEYGSLRLKPFEDSLKGENDIAYSRVDIVNDSVIRIVYSTLKETRCAYAKVYTETRH